MTNPEDQIKTKMLTFQRNEITEYHLYSRIAKSQKSPENRKILSRIAEEELAHYHFWENLTGQEVQPNRLQLGFYYLLSRLLGFTFSAKLLESKEEDVQDYYAELRPVVPDIDRLIQDEQTHEQALLDLLDEESLRYTGSIVLGLNDALVELTGALAGLTLALRNSSLIALTGLITGSAAALSMAASEYLSTKSEGGDQEPIRAALYTGVAYILTVFLLILPYLLLSNLFLALGLTLSTAVTIIAAFNYYISVAKDLPFRDRFLEMAGISLGVAIFSFAVGALLRSLFGFDT
ncbi:MAG: rubrerythrin family protein [Anaerolineales bacterium]|nr:rubrerythrin family protein [Anaerolineales bacterium]